MAKRIKFGPLPEECFADTDRFKIQVYRDDGELIDEYELDAEKDAVPSLSVAKDRALHDASKHRSGRLVIVVSGQTLTRLRQIQIDVDLDNKQKGS